MFRISYTYVSFGEFFPEDFIASTNFRIFFSQFFFAQVLTVISFFFFFFTLSYLSYSF